MHSDYLGIEDARKRLGKLADEAAIVGVETMLTRHGRPIARVAPLERPVPEPTHRVVTRLFDVIVDARNDYTLGWIFPPGVVGHRDHTGQDEQGRALESVRLPVSEDRVEWDQAADAALAEAGWVRQGEWQPGLDDTATVSVRPRRTGDGGDR